MSESFKKETINQSPNNSEGVIIYKFVTREIGNPNNLRSGYREDLEPVEFENTKDYSLSTCRKILFETENGNLEISLEVGMISGDKNRTEFAVGIKTNDYSKLPNGTKLLIYAEKEEGSLPSNFIGNIGAENYNDGDFFRFDDQIADGQTFYLDLKTFISEINKGIHTSNPEKFEIVIAIPQNNSYLIAHSTSDDLIKSFEDCKNVKSNSEIKNSNLWGKLVSWAANFVTK